LALKKYADALASFQATLTIMTQLAQDDPQNAMFGDLLASSYANIGEVATISKKWDEAIESYQKGVGLLQELRQKEPANLERERRINDLQVSWKPFLLLRAMPRSVIATGGAKLSAISQSDGQPLASSIVWSAQ